MSGALIVLEGIDGSGKTTLAGALAAALASRGHRVVSTKEPTDGPIGREIRRIAATGRDAISAEEELRLFHEDRRLHVAEVVRPALEAGAIVVQDRSYFSTVAYQGERGLDRSELLATSRAIAPEPDLLLVVDLPAELAIERIRASRPAAADDFEKLESLARIREIFLALPGAVVLDGRRARADLLADALSAVTRHLPISPRS